MLAPSKIKGTTLDHALLAEGCIISAKSIERSVIGIRSRIGDGSTVKNIVSFGSDYFETLEDFTQEDIIPMGVGKNCHIERAILDKNCRIGDDVVIKGHPDLEDTETDQYRIIDGIIVVKKGIIIPSGSRIGHA